MSLIKTLLTMIFMSTAILGQIEHSSKSQLRQENFLTEEQARQELAAFAQSYSNLEEWQSRAT